MHASVILLLIITFLYASYNLLIKVSTDFVPEGATSTILATMALQAAALAVSSVLAVFLILRGNQALSLSAPAYGWAIAAGVCIGLAEIGYFYLFRGFLSSDPVPAGIAIPTIVGGTILIAFLASWLVFSESFTWLRFLGIVLIITGVIAIFAGNEQVNS